MFRKTVRWIVLGLVAAATQKHITEHTDEPW